MNNTSIKTRVVGVDVSVDNTTYAIVDVRGNILAKESFPTFDYPDISNFITKLSENIMMLAEANGGYDKIRSIGISVPSANYLTGSIENAGNLPWKGIIPLAAMLRDRMGLAVAVANDAHTTALGEKVFGSAHGKRDFIVVSLGHGGIGSCFFSNGEPHLGTNGFAGEIGHTCVVENGRQCTCGSRGCLEAYSSARGLKQNAEELLAATDAPSLLRDGGELTPERITECCEQGDAIAIEAMRLAGSILGHSLANYATVINPEAVIMTGSMIKAGKWLLDPMVKTFEESVFQNIRDRVKLLVSILDNNDRDVLGASALAWDVPEYSLFK